MKDPYRTRVTLIQRVKNQEDGQAWEEFVRFYEDYIYAIIRRMEISEDDAEDLLQQVLVNLWSTLPRMEQEHGTRFRSLLRNVTRHRVIDFIRKRTSEARRMEKVSMDEAFAYLQTIRLPEIDSIADREWEIHLANLAVDRIAPLFSGKAIEAFRLSLSGMSVEEVAEELGLKENSVYRLKNRVKARLVNEVAHLRTLYE